MNKVERSLQVYFLFKKKKCTCFSFSLEPTPPFLYRGSDRNVELGGGRVANYTCFDGGHKKGDNDGVEDVSLYFTTCF